MLHNVNIKFKLANLLHVVDATDMRSKNCYHYTIIHTQIGVAMFCRYHYMLVINLVLLFDRLNFIRCDVALELL